MSTGETTENTTIDHAARLRGFAADLRSIKTGGGSTLDAAADEIDRLRRALDSISRKQHPAPSYYARLALDGRTP